MDANERLTAARAEIARRQSLAAAVLHFSSPWAAFPSDEENDAAVGYDTTNPLAGLICTTPDYGTYHLPEFIAANDPQHSLAALRIAVTVLDRHARTHTCAMRWTDDGTEAGQYVWPVLLCADVKPVLDLYAPEEPA